MQTKKRIERLEDNLRQAVKWNFANLSTNELIELRDLHRTDPKAAWNKLQSYLDEGIVSYEYRKAT